MGETESRGRQALLVGRSLSGGQAGVTGPQRGKMAKGNKCIGEGHTALFEPTCWEVGPIQRSGKATPLKTTQKDQWDLYAKTLAVSSEWCPKLFAFLQVMEQ